MTLVFRVALVSAFLLALCIQVTSALGIGAAFRRRAEALQHLSPQTPPNHGVSLNIKQISNKSTDEDGFAIQLTDSNRGVGSSGDTVSCITSSSKNVVLERKAGSTVRSEARGPVDGLSTTSSTTQLKMAAIRAAAAMDSFAVHNITTASSASTANRTQTSLCVNPGTSPALFRMNVGGGAVASAASAAMGAENENYIDSKSNGGISLSDNTNITSTSGPGPWDQAYTTYRWTEGSVLKYRIPVAKGTYNVKLLFAETMHMSASARVFDIYINGAEKEQALDVYAEVGKDVGLLKEYNGINSAAFVEIALIQVIDHPMLSGIIIEGLGADSKAVGGGCSSADDADLEFNNGFDHRAHAVPNGPYNAIDFDKIGSAMVLLDGTLSHSHFSDPGPPEVSGRIVSYRWSWTETINGTEVKKEHRDKSGRFRSRFPMGRTLVTLQVVDSTGDSSSDYAEVNVKPPTKPGVYCYGYDLGNASMPSIPNLTTLDWLQGQKPQYGSERDLLSFRSSHMFGDDELFENSFIYRCSFFIQGNGINGRSISMRHNGSFVLYESGAFVTGSVISGETDLNLSITGLQEYEILYFRNITADPLLELLADGRPVEASELSHDGSAVIPVITRISENRSRRSGGGNVRIFGTGFFPDVRVFFGDIEASNVLRISSKLVQVRVPPGKNGEVKVTVRTKVATSNGAKFVYADPTDSLRQPIIFRTRHLQHPRKAQKQNLPLVASVVYGPDFRLYLGTYSKGQIHAVTVGDYYKLLALCTHRIGEGRSALGLAFSPFRNQLRLYFSSSTVFWKKFLPFQEGWVNGKIESVDFSWRYRISGDKATGACSFNQQDVVTGLPVSAHDHSVNKLEFMPDGRLLITIGGFTNGGISIPGRKRIPGDPPDDRFGGVASNPLSAAIVSCPVNKVTRITYDQYTDPEKARIVNGTDCFVYASGIRNSFGMTLHTNGHVYVTDNGGSRGNGDFATDCDGGSIPATKQKDKLFRVQPGGYHGHPNLNRRECRHYPPDAVQPILNGIESSTDGVMEYRSNVFGGRLKGDLVLTKFALNNRQGRVSQVRLDDKGGIAERGYIENLYGQSGLAVAEGPRGELVMPQVYQNGILFVYPMIRRPTVTFVIGVLPKRGPASGGARVLVSGFGFLANSTVWFGDQECGDVRVVHDRKLSCKTPKSERNRLVSVVVEGISGKSPSYGSDYWYF